MAQQRVCASLDQQTRKDSACAQSPTSLRRQQGAEIAKKYCPKITNRRRKREQACRRKDSRRFCNTIEWKYHPSSDAHKTKENEQRSKFETKWATGWVANDSSRRQGNTKGTDILLSRDQNRIKVNQLMMEYTDLSDQTRTGFLLFIRRPALMKHWSEVKRPTHCRHV